MSGELNIQDKMFLGKEELTKLQDMLNERIRIRTFSAGYGIIGGMGNEFAVTAGSSGTIIIGSGCAIDINGDIRYSMNPTQNFLSMSQKRIIPPANFFKCPKSSMYL